MLKDFNMLISTARRNERAMVNEILFLLKNHLCDQEATASRTAVRGVIVAKTSFDPYIAIEKLYNILDKHPYEFRFALRIIPIERVISTDLEEIKKTALEMATRINKNETYRITIEKRFTTLHTTDIISAVATEIQHKADMKNPNKIILIEIIGATTGISLIKPNEIISIMKEKML